jgi:cyclopropane fatty-acyl-phospholipid synthase-like methyltransferase
MLPSRSTVLDLGCGRGFYSRLFAADGHDVDGIDFSTAAVSAARDEALRRGLRRARFTVCEISSFRSSRQYDLAFDYSVFHHVPIEDRPAYLATLRASVRPGGYLGIVCYSERDPDAKGASSRVSDLGNVIYHPRRQEVIDLLVTAFDLQHYGPSILGRRRNHQGHHFLFRRRHDRHRIVD